jgi:branched-chain amino acid transport system permease protein
MNVVGRIVLAAAGGDMSRAAQYRQLVVMSILYLVLVAIIALTAGGFWLINLTAAFATMLALMGTSLLFGQLGLVSLCQYALVGIGGWVALYLFHTYHLPFEVVMLAGGIVSALVGVIWGLPALRFRGIYLALVTLMLAGAFQAFITAFNFPVGSKGATGLERALIDRPVIATGDVPFFIYTAVVCLIGLIIVEAHRRSKPGRAWALIRNEPQLAIASGVHIVTYQAWAFALAGFLAGIGGALLAGTYRQLDSTGFGASESITLFAASVLGGTTNWVGTVIGGLLVRVVPTLLDNAGVSATIGTALFGFGLMMAIIGGPAGLAGLYDDLVDRLSEKEARDAAAGEGGAGA